MQESTSCTSQTKSCTLSPGFGKAEGGISGWPPEPPVKTDTERHIPSTRASPLQGGQKKLNQGHYCNTPRLQRSGPQPLNLPKAPRWVFLCTCHILGTPGFQGMSHPLFCQVCVCTCVCSCKCTLSHTLEHAHAHSPVLRKSKIAVSLNSFPLAARTAFVLQTKRKRNETEGSEEAGEGGREGARAKEQTEKEGNSKGEREEGKASRARGRGNSKQHRKAGWGARREVPLHPRQDPSPRHHQNLNDRMQQLPFPAMAPQKGTFQTGTQPEGEKNLTQQTCPK